MIGATIGALVGGIAKIWIFTRIIKFFLKKSNVEDPQRTWLSYLIFYLLNMVLLYLINGQDYTVGQVILDTPFFIVMVIIEVIMIRKKNKVTLNP